MTHGMVELAREVAQAFVSEAHGRFCHIYDQEELRGVPDGLRVKVVIEWLEPVEWSEVVPQYEVEKA